ncbi:testis-expressed protein 9 isoform X1 [Paramormyrops kingsleyae]|uniref:Testis expressed 9 n=2 Tax=Paramormyrops kingsleyae TaxID=1676925 RepID=A0A3B3QIB7_9TELE|nr:testis-expressed protein 9 isoform X1 [Paramormyrops kingsleyae]XP_023669770.1 testis-expressed protein 9 isoform X1 [Paramormyrops kingsleyae]
MTGDRDAYFSAAGKMAEARRTSSSQELRRASSSRTTKSQGGRPFNRPSTVPQLKAPQTDLLLKEEEYKRLNAELEAKAAELVQQAEELMREQNEVLAKPIPSHIGIDLDIEDDEKYYRNLSLTSPTDKQSSLKAVNKRKNISKKASVQSRPPSGQQIKSKALAASAADDVAIVEDFVDFSLAKTISSIKGKLEEGATPEDVMGDVMPSVGEEMGSEAQIRYLKAKLRVTQEEVNRLCHECNIKDDEICSLTAKKKESEAERSRLQRMTSVQQAQMEKHKALAEDSSRKSEGLQQQVETLKKEIESLRRAQKQAASTHSATEVRLNRALEEVERCRVQLCKIKQSGKDSASQEHQKMEVLQAENKKLEKQKAELIAGFKKQLRLIDILKRQKMHFEAAKMLSFTEEEFVKALDWETS